MGRIMGNHPDVFFFNELHYFEQLATGSELNQIVLPGKAKRLLMRLFTVQHDGYFHQGDPSRYKPDAKKVMQTLPVKDYTSIDVFQAFLLYDSKQAGKKYPLVHTPQNIFYLPEILALLPDARIINMIRDPRDVLLSQKRRWRRRFLDNKHIPLRQVLRYWVNYHPVTISRLWNAAIQAADRFQDNPNLHQLRFRDLVSAPQKHVQQLCKFAEIPYHEGMENVPQIGSSSGKDHPDRKKINPNAASRWKQGGLSKTELFLCQIITRKNMRKHGYDREPVRPSIFALPWQLLLFPIKISLALILNLHRMKSVVETIKRRLK